MEGFVFTLSNKKMIRYTLYTLISMILLLILRYSRFSTTFCSTPWREAKQQSADGLMRLIYRWILRSTSFRPRMQPLLETSTRFHAAMVLHIHSRLERTMRNSFKVK